MTRLSPRPAHATPITRRHEKPPVLPGALAVAIATAYLEVRAGRRPPDQLWQVATPTVQRSLARLVRATRGLQRPAGGVAVRRVVTCEPTDGVFEAAVVVHDGHCMGAVAVRLERLGSRWWVTALGAPEDQR